MARRPKTGIDRPGTVESPEGGAVTEHTTGVAHIAEKAVTKLAVIRY